MPPTTPQKLSSDQFAEQIKTKYPQYKNVDNATLTQKMLQKYPTYSSKVDLGASAPGASQTDKFLSSPNAKAIMGGGSDSFATKDIKEAFSATGPAPAKPTNIAQDIFQQVIGSKGIAGAVGGIAKTIAQPFAAGTVKNLSENAQKLSDTIFKQEKQVEAMPNGPAKTKAWGYIKDSIGHLNEILGEANDVSGKLETPGQLAGASLNTALAATALTSPTGAAAKEASPGLTKLFGKYAPAVAKIAESSVYGAASSYANNLIDGTKDAHKIVDDAIKTGALSALGTGIITGVSSLIQRAPESIIQRFVGKFGKGKDISQLTDYITENKSIGTTAGLVDGSIESQKKISGAISDVLSGDKYKDTVLTFGEQAPQKGSNWSWTSLSEEDGSPVKFSVPVGQNVKPSSNILADGIAAHIGDPAITSDRVVSEARDLLTQDIRAGESSVAPLLDKEALTLKEANELRSRLDRASATLYTSQAKPPLSKTLAKSMADGLRAFVQTTAPETVPLFNNAESEATFQKAVKAWPKGGLGLKDYLTFFGFLAEGGGASPQGILAGAAGVAGERLASTPGAAIGAAKVGQTLAPVAGQIGAIAAPLGVAAKRALSPSNP